VIKSVTRALGMANVAKTMASLPFFRRCGGCTTLQQPCFDCTERARVFVLKYGFVTKDRETLQAEVRKEWITSVDRLPACLLPSLPFSLPSFLTLFHTHTGPPPEHRIL
jgi:hypothetical protein